MHLGDMRLRLGATRLILTVALDVCDIAPRTGRDLVARLVAAS